MLTADHRRALELLSVTEDGCTTAILLAHGFPSTLIGDGLATAHTKAMQAGARRLDGTRVRITNAGRQELDRD